MVFFTILILFSIKDKNYPYISKSAVTVILIQLIMHFYLLVQMFRVNAITNPLVALKLINQVALVYQVLGVATLVISFVTFVVFAIRLGAYSLRQE